MVTSLKLTQLVRRHPRFFALMAFMAFAVGAALWMGYYYPQRVIREFYSAIEGKHEDSAWNLLHEGYKQRWKADPTVFKAGYRTTVSYADVEIENTERPWNVLRFLQGNEIEYVVSFRVEDRFTRADTSAKDQALNMLWLQIAHPKDYERLVNGTLERDGSVGNATLVLERRYKQRVKLTRVGRFEWKIASIATLESGIVRDVGR